MKNSESVFFVFSEWKFLRMIWWLCSGVSNVFLQHSTENTREEPLWVSSWGIILIVPLPRSETISFSCSVELWDCGSSSITPPQSICIFFPFFSSHLFLLFSVHIHFVGHTCHSLAANSMFCYWKKICIQGSLINHNHYVIIRQTFAVEYSSKMGIVQVFLLYHTTENLKYGVWICGLTFPSRIQPSIRPNCVFVNLKVHTMMDNTRNSIFSLLLFFTSLCIFV